MRNLNIFFQLEEKDIAKLEAINNIYESFLYLEGDARDVTLYRLNKKINSQITEMQESIQKGDDNYKKYVLYTGHFQSLWAMLSNMGLASSKCVKEEYDSKTDNEKCFEKPVFNSSLILKIFKNGVDMNVRVIYNGNDISAKLDGCSLENGCNLEEFKTKFLNPNIFANDGDLDIKCLNYDINLGNKLIALAVACILFGIIMIIVFIKLLKKRLKKN